MTFEQLAHEHLFNNGMFEKDVNAVVEMAKKDEVIGKNMAGRWSDDLSYYPPQMKIVFLVGLNEVALKYIDANMPKAWFRACFE